MNTVPQTEKETVDQELKFLTREGYEESIVQLSFNALLDECLRQYDLSGQMLAKYREASEKLSHSRYVTESYRRSHSLLRNALALLQRDLMDLRIELDSIKLMTEISDDYTHSMKRTVFKMITTVAKKTSNRLFDLSMLCRDELENSWKRVGEQKAPPDEIPF